MRKWRPLYKMSVCAWCILGNAPSLNVRTVLRASPAANVEKKNWRDPPLQPVRRRETIDPHFIRLELLSCPPCPCLFDPAPAGELLACGNSLILPTSSSILAT